MLSYAEPALGMGQPGPCQSPAPCGGSAQPFWDKSHLQKQVKFGRSDSHFDGIYTVIFMFAEVFVTDCFFK